MLAAWLAHVAQVDPDAFYLYQVCESASFNVTSLNAKHLLGLATEGHLSFCPVSSLPSFRSL